MINMAIVCDVDFATINNEIERFTSENGVRPYVAMHSATEEYINAMLDEYDIIHKEHPNAALEKYRSYYDESAGCRLHIDDTMRLGVICVR